jgi:hypothetical protein
MGATGSMGAMAPSGYGELPGASIPSGVPSAAGVSNFTQGAAQNPYVQAGGAALGGLGSVMGWIQNMQRDKLAAQQAKALSDPSQLMAGFPTSPAFTDPVNRALNANWAVNAGGTSGGALNQFAADAWAKLASEYMANRIAALRGAGSIYQGQPTQQTNQLGSVLNQLGVLARIPGQAQQPPRDPLVAFSGTYNTAPEYNRFAETGALTGGYAPIS